MGQDAFPVQLPRDIGVVASPHWIVAQTPAWLGHIPFAFWVVTAAEPRVVAELGCHYGNSYFAFAQSAAGSSLSTSLFAIDTWVGDEHSGLYGSEVFEAVRDYNEKTYPTMSQLIRSTFDDACGHFEDGSIDLLNIDGHHTYESVRHDFESWFPKMSDRGIVLFHDIAVRERGFGVHRLWDELSSKYDSFAFEHSHGLGVLGVGSEIPQAVGSLLALRPGSEDASAVQQLFASLGRRVVLEGTLESQVAAARTEIDQRLAAADAAHAEVVAALRVEAAEAIAAAGAEHADALATVRAEADRAMAAATADHARALAAAQDASDRAVAALQIQVDLAEAAAARSFDERLDVIFAAKTKEP